MSEDVALLEEKYDQMEAVNAELLEVLKRLASAVCHLGLTEYHGSLAVTVDAAFAAIAKAEGGSNEDL